MASILRQDLTVSVPRMLAGLMAILVVVGCGMDMGDDQAASTADGDMFEGTATTVDGEEVDLAAFADRDLVVWFWAPW
jgi:hypothetical protein